MNPPFWSNQDIVLYHGTTRASAERIEAGGVDLSRSIPLRDFGTGFYTTTNYKQAHAFARDKSYPNPLGGAVVQVIVPRNAIATLDTLSFVLGDREAGHYWSFVQSCRAGMLQHGRGRTAKDRSYDVVFGPVAKDFVRLLLHPTYDQISFHTADGIALLNEDRQRRMILPWTTL